MASLANRHLTNSEYERLYSQEKGWEYWFGEARRKPVPTEYHGILQLLLGLLLREDGYRASTETELRIAPDWYPRPDVTGISGKPVGRYPNQPVDVVLEVISDDENAVEKCRLYASIGITQIFCFDLQQRQILQWSQGQLVHVTNVNLQNGAVILDERIWREFEADLHR